MHKTTIDMLGIELPVFFHNDSTDYLKDMGIDFELEDTDIRTMTFYRIDAVSPYIDNDKEYGMIHCSGSKFIINMNVAELILKLANY